MPRVQLAIPSQESEDEIGISDEEFEMEAELGLADSEDEETVEEEETHEVRKAKDLNWQKRRTILPVPKWRGALPDPTMVCEPIQYFERLLGRDVFEDVATQTNLYAVQVDPSKPLNVSVDEIQQFFGISLYMSAYGFPYTRMYWATNIRVDKIADVMSLSRWETIKRFLHFADNNKQVAEGQPGFDKLFKVRPLLDCLLKSFRDIPIGEMLCVDEQIVPFKGRSGLKTYNPKKPKRWGYKIFVLADQHGIVHNFEFYTGAVPAVEGVHDIGSSGNIVLRLASVIPP
ncbi:hypothetical protein ACEWY4_019115 [Coilia grayii]|uniref:PiggyBac transposable element-derived protein domain-containing protein n=1 Tax=Coilia grayii TaxID=363190 RepID=A0ABD1JGP9_9TELE